MAKTKSNEIIADEIIVAPARGKAVSVIELAEILALDENSVRAYISEGMPTYKLGGRGVAHILSTRDCLDWIKKKERDAILAKYRSQNQKPEDENPDRLKSIKIERAELELAERRGDLVHIADWVPAIEEACVHTRQRFLSIPNEFRNQFVDAPRIGQMTRWINNAITLAVNSLATALNDLPETVDDDR